MVMRKMLIFMLVLGMASFASASIVNVELVSGTIGAGNTITVGFVASSGTVDGLSISDVVEGTTVNANNELTNVVDKDGVLVDKQSGSGYATSEALYGPATGVTIQNDGTIGMVAGAISGGLFYSAATTASPATAAGIAIVKFDYTISPTWDGSSYWIGPLVSGVNYEYYPGYYANSGTTLATVGGTPGPIGGLYIPEPATIALLGLGGLALLRRRRK
jgi:hypothetical protein